MPSIELICVDQHEGLILPKLAFAVRSEPVLQSHRSPSPLFQSDFDQVRGYIYHLGNPNCDKLEYEGPFFAYELLSERCQGSSQSRFMEFAPEFVLGVRELIGLLLKVSPIGRVIFTTDWQFGPSSAKRYSETTEKSFWASHTNQKLRMNALYPIISNSVVKPAKTKLEL